MEIYGSGMLNLGYLGGVYDADTGLIYMGNGQYYDPSTGRFLTRGAQQDQRNPYTPWNSDPAGMLIAPLALLALVFGRKKTRTKFDQFIILFVIVLAVGLSVSACSDSPDRQGESGITLPENGIKIDIGSDTVITITPTSSETATNTPTYTCTPSPTNTATSTITSTPTPMVISQVLIASGTWACGYGKCSAHDEGPLPENQVGNWIKDARKRGYHVETQQYIGSTTDENGKYVLYAKYNQLLHIEAKSLDKNTLVIGYSGGADTALLYADKHDVSGLVLLGPTFTGKIDQSNSLDFSDSLARQMFEELADSGVRVVIVDDNDELSLGKNYKHNNVYYIPFSSSRPHHTDQNTDLTGTNANPDLIEAVWKYLLTGKETYGQ